MYIRNDIEYTIRDDFTCPPELCYMSDYFFYRNKTKEPVKNTLVGVFYRTPGIDSVNIFANHLKR